MICDGKPFLYLYWNTSLTLCRTYMNETSVIEEVNSIRKRSNLLLWYTADEPDGTSAPLNATFLSQTLIESLDGGGYHPVSLVLNCKDYQWSAYTEGASVIMSDPYTIGINATYSVRQSYSTSYCCTAITNFLNRLPHTLYGRLRRLRV